MPVYTSAQIINCVPNSSMLTTQDYIRLADYIADNIVEITAKINEAKKTGAKSIFLDILGLDYLSQ